MSFTAITDEDWQQITARRARVSGPRPAVVAAVSTALVLLVGAALFVFSSGLVRHRLTATWSSSDIGTGHCSFVVELRNAGWTAVRVTSVRLAEDAPLTVVGAPEGELSSGGTRHLTLRSAGPDVCERVALARRPVTLAELVIAYHRPTGDTMQTLALRGDEDPTGFTLRW